MSEQYFKSVDNPEGGVLKFTAAEIVDHKKNMMSEETQK